MVQDKEKEQRPRRARRGRAAKPPASTSGDDDLKPLGFRTRAAEGLSSSPSARGRRFALLLLAEVSVVFLGVFGAVVAEDYRQGRQDEAQSRRIARSLDESLRDLAEHNRTVGGRIDADLAAFDRARAQGLRPLPPFHRESGAERPPTLIWEALLASDGARLLPPELLFEFARFFNRMHSHGEKYTRYNEFTEAHVLPVLDQGPGAFYMNDGPELRPEYRQHVQRLRELRTLEVDLVRQGAQLRTLLARAAAD